MNNPATSAQTEPESFVSRLLSPVLYRRAQVAAKQQLAPGLYHIRLQGPQLCHQSWNCGDKIQIKVASTLVNRTYTPIRWDAQLGETDFIAHSLADGPGSLWVNSVQVGQEVLLFGPRRSLNVSKLDATKTVLVGDETAIGLALAFKPAHTLLELAGAQQLKPILTALGLSNFSLFERDLSSGLPADLIQNLLDNTNPSVLLAGRSASVKQLQKQLRERNKPAATLLSKVYWADGKTGLD